ncbi:MULTISPECIES: FliC/FljB family flagellin [unclassified Brenneria]|uniref:FliC/FljB family flagellin n=1 Tax=unclassified Brenneria TaxID=2634434 RepID=UPI00155529E4|nr:FliC/FljB family flagellin [Brenneria sp. hezel4-2-4]MEE3649692.1 FliC/FljB family flagellin [Brenneria sp. HEZEL_4_2_4]NPC99650.1 FliC/FljB family flagellin [Brenneria sp. hezel4-2-4]
MAQVINTNSISLVAQNNLNKSQASLSTAIERLSSGLKINSAADNAAGQAISNRFTSSINGLTQASSNASDGISLAQTTEGALNEINDNLQAIRTLTVQAQNGTNSSSDLTSIQDEITQRLSEIDRISEQTDFNGVKVLDGSKTSVSIQVGSNDGQTITINLSKINSSTLGLSTFNVSGPAAGTISAATATNFKAAYGTTTAVTASTVTATGTTTDAAKAAFGLSSTTSAITVAGTAQVDANGNWFAKVTVTAGNQTDSDNLALRGISVEAGASASFYVAIDPADADTATAAGTAAFTLTADDLTATTLQSQATADPLAKLDEAISTVDKLRSNLGAVQNRFESTINNLSSTTTNLSEAQSRIQDADYATEVSNMSKAQILQQAGTSVLAQANQVPQTVLSLLQ